MLTASIDTDAVSTITLDEHKDDHEYATWLGTLANVAGSEPGHGNNKDLVKEKHVPDIHIQDAIQDGLIRDRYIEYYDIPELQTIMENNENHITEGFLQRNISWLHNWFNKSPTSKIKDQWSHDKCSTNPHKETWARAKSCVSDDSGKGRSIGDISHIGMNDIGAADTADTGHAATELTSDWLSREDAKDITNTDQSVDCTANTNRQLCKEAGHLSHEDIKDYKISPHIGQPNQMLYIDSDMRRPTNPTPPQKEAGHLSHEAIEDCKITPHIRKSDQMLSIDSNLRRPTNPTPPQKEAGHLSHDDIEDCNMSPHIGQSDQMLCIGSNLGRPATPTPPQIGATKNKAFPRLGQSSFRSATLARESHLPTTHKQTPDKNTEKLKENTSENPQREDSSQLSKNEVNLAVQSDVENKNDLGEKSKVSEQGGSSSHAVLVKIKLPYIAATLPGAPIYTAELVKQLSPLAHIEEGDHALTGQRIGEPPVWPPS